MQNAHFSQISCSGRLTTAQFEYLRERDVVLVEYTYDVDVAKSFFRLRSGSEETLRVIAEWFTDEFQDVEVSS